MITNPHNPTGKVFSLKELLKLTAILEKYPHVMVISDDVYYRLPFDGREHHLFADIGDNFKKTITIFSAGKMLNCTGWKVGWAIGPQDLIKNTSYVHEAACYNINVPG
jgi:aspartate/methionine/tyrosine aminotransferase